MKPNKVTAENFGVTMLAYAIRSTRNSIEECRKSRKNYIATMNAILEDNGVTREEAQAADDWEDWKSIEAGLQVIEGRISQYHADIEQFTRQLNLLKPEIPGLRLKPKTRRLAKLALSGDDFDILGRMGIAS